MYPHINALVNILNAHEKPWRLYLVGGTVRDQILKKPIQDYDLVITGIQGTALEKLLACYGRVELVGKSFGVYKWRPKGTSQDTAKLQKDIDIALPRRESGWGTGGRRDFTVYTDHTLPIEADLQRRDFTINAIAYDVLNEVYIDPWNGRRDLAKKIIQTVGKPEDRFQEDYSRIIRGLRLACQLKFTIEQETWKVMKRRIKNIQHVTPEITAEELVKALQENPSRAMQLFDESGLWKALIKEVIEMKSCTQPKRWHSEGSVWVHTALALTTLEKKVPRPWDLSLVFALLFHDIGKPKTKKIRNGRMTFYNHDRVGATIAGRIISRLKLESAGVDKGQVMWLISNHMIVFCSDPNKLKNTTIEKYFLSDRYPSDHLLTLIECDSRATLPADPSKTHNLKGLSIIKRRIKKIKIKPKKTLLNGHEIMTLLGIPPSPEIGKVLHTLREAELEGEVGDKKQAIEFIKKQARDSLT